ncbi:MAG: helix-turn-helix domain-containing protein [Pseudomonadota bacterium]
MNSLKEKFGNVYTPREMAEYLGVDEGTVKKYYADLGGMRLGRRTLFFEKRLERMLFNADIPEKEKGVACLREKERDKDTEALSDQADSESMGSKPEKISREELTRRDTFGLLA